MNTSHIAPLAGSVDLYDNICVFIAYKSTFIVVNPSPQPSRFPSTLEISLGFLSAVGDGFPNASLVLVEHGYIPAVFKGFCVLWDNF